MAVRITRKALERLLGQSPDPKPKVKAAMVPEAVRGVPSSYTVTIPGWHPATVNELGRSVGAKIRLKKRDKKVVGSYFVHARVPAAWGKRRVHLLLVYGPSERRVDPDGSFKSLLDALTWHRFLKNDSLVWCELAPVLTDRGPERKAVITLEDIA